MNRIRAMKRVVRRGLGRARHRLELRARDRHRNRRWAGEPKRFLIVRHAGKDPQFYDVILEWVEEHVPEIRGLFELRLLPCWVLGTLPDGIKTRGSTAVFGVRAAQH